MMTKRLKYFLILPVALMFCATANAQSLKEARAQDAEENALAKEVAFTASICKTSIASSIDWRSAANWPADISLANVCDGALGALESVCRSDEGKARAAKIKRFVCAGDGGGPSLNGSTLRFGANPRGNGFAATQQYLSEKL